MNVERYAAFDLLATLVALARSDGTVLFVNSGFEAAVGSSRRALIGTSLFDRFADPAPLRETLLAVARNETATGRLEATLVGAAMAAEELPVHVIVTQVEPPGGAAGEAFELVLVEMLEVEQQTRQDREERALGQLSANRELMRNLAHEIKNPLGGIRGAAQLLERELEAPGLKEYTRIIVEEVDRLRSLIDRMLAPRTSAEPDGLNIHEVLEHVRGLVEAECDGARAIAVDYDPSLPEIRGVRDHLVQVFLNVVRNAAEAARPGGRVVIRTRAQRLVTIGVRLHKLALRVDVVDDGPGVPVELGQSIFYPMVSGRADGTGLGLAIAQSLVHRHGGMIEFESRPGETAFTVYIPLENEH